MSSGNGVGRYGITNRGGGWFELPTGHKVRGEENAIATMQIARTQAMMASTEVGRMRFLQKAGLQYGGKRDVYKTAGYIPPGQETYEDYYALYERDPLGGRIVDLAPSTTWKSPPSLSEPGMDEEQGTPFTQDFAVLVQSLKLWHRLERVDRLSRIGRYGILLIGARGTDSSLKTELPRMQGPEDVLYLSAYPEGDVKIHTWVKDHQDPRFGLPETYEVDLSSGVESFGSFKEVVHASRVIHVAEGLLADEVYGRPALKRVLNPLFDLQKLAAATGEGYWQMAARILQGTIDPDVELPEGFLDTMGDAMEEIVHDLRRQFLGYGTKLDWMEGELPRPKEAAEFFLQLVAAGSGYPLRVLLGTERGELASTLDERSFLGTINERQEKHAEPNILRAVIDRLVDHGALAPPGEEGYDVQWPTLFEESELDQAEANKARADTAKALTPVGGNPYDLIEVDKDRNVWLIPTDDPRVEALRGEAGGETFGDEEDEGGIEEEETTAVTEGLEEEEEEESEE